MDSIEYVERTATATLMQACTAYDDILDRVYKFSTLVAGGPVAQAFMPWARLGRSVLAKLCRWQRFPAGGS